MITRITLTDIKNIITETVNRIITEHYYDASLNVANSCKKMLQDIFTHWCMIRYCEMSNLNITTVNHWNSEINNLVSSINNKLSRLKTPTSRIKAFGLMISRNHEFMPDENGMVDYDSALHLFSKKYQEEMLGLKLSKLNVEVGCAVLDDWAIYVNSSLKKVLIGDALQEVSKFKKK